jgi:hypothetical protein
VPRLGSLAGACLTATVATVAAALVASVLPAAPAQAASLGPADLPPPVTLKVPTPAPGHQLMLDTCSTPSQADIKAWQRYSPYKAIAAYIPARSDMDMWACRDSTSAANLTPAWVDQVLSGGWNLMPIQVGLQAPCSGFSKRMSSSASKARSQGVLAASDAAARVRALGIPATSPVVADIEAYAGSAACSTAVTSYVAGWTARLHQLGLRSAVYGSKASTIKDVVAASASPSYVEPDVIWVANYNGQANTTFDASVMSSTQWAGRRVSQFNPNVTRSFGGSTLTIDEDAVQVSVWDRSAPRLVAQQPPSATRRKRVKVGWRSVDASGVARYQVRVKHNAGRWKYPKELRRTKRTNRTFSLSPGERWCVSVRATDRVGNTSAWSAPRCTTRFVDDASMRAGRAWKRVHASYLGTGTKTSRKGVTLRGKRVSGSRVGVILHGRGTVRVLIGGHVVGEVHGNGTKWITLPRTRSGRLALRTTTRAKVVVDGYVVTS